VEEWGDLALVIPNMGILGDLFCTGDSFWPPECAIVGMVVEMGAALSGPRFYLGE